jgi:hypothetical protein
MIDGTVSRPSDPDTTAAVIVLRAHQPLDDPPESDSRYAFPLH